MIYKYKTFDEAQRALWNFNPDAKYYEQVRQLFLLSSKLYPIQCRRGIFLFKTIEEANEFRKQEELTQALKNITNSD
ncbi:MAG TPA: hypothetical protein PLH80_10965 [Spirochaetota bacterium]|jgi:hypothetical protein|nr:hypothetical protein [Spirochaetota bacterium]HOM89045.1 hypothetical protein [Spirochaetota bacterium]HOR94125.1 hypothetical protein [Spirochaetota bacterium]HPD03710.1 hypothetical protein [Spirochaetota bacterium]HPK45037.1 hypothetical protein [Spirochaetota bacterium]